MENPAYEQFKEEFPEVAKVFGRLYESVSHKALDAGATKEEIKEAMMLAIPAGGLCDFLSVLPDMMNELDVR